MTAPPGPSLRLFVAIELSREWLEALARAQARLREALERRDGPRLRWVRPEGIHLTLKFLGWVNPEKLASVEWALESATSEPPAFSLQLVRLGAFNDRRGPRVIWAGLDGATVPDREALYLLAARIETWFEAAGFPREDRFAPHLTLARVPDAAPMRERRSLVDVTSAIRLEGVPALRVGAVSLMRSHLGPGGARYERLATFPRKAP